MEYEILLSIIIPMYNSEKHITQCIESCYGQGLEENNFEVVIIDDGSTDNSASIVNDMLNLHANMQIIHQDNHGQGAARNKGLAVARGKYVMFVDSDDYLLEDCLDGLVNRALSYDAEILRFKMEIERKDGSVATDSFEFVFEDKVYTGEELLVNGINIGSVCTTLWSRNFLKTHNFKFLTDIKHEDVAFNYSVYPYVKRGILCDKAAYFYKYNTGSTDRTQDIQKRRKLVESDLYIASMLKSMSMRDEFSMPLRNYYLSTSNSIVVSNFLQSLKKSSSFTARRQFVKLANSFNLFPIKGRCTSWKTSLLVPVINVYARLCK